MKFLWVLGETERLFMNDLETTGTHENTVFPVSLGERSDNSRFGSLAVVGGKLPVGIESP